MPAKRGKPTKPPEPVVNGPAELENAAALGVASEQDPDAVEDQRDDMAQARNLFATHCRLTIFPR